MDIATIMDQADLTARWANNDGGARRSGLWLARRVLRIPDNGRLVGRMSERAVRRSRAACAADIQYALATKPSRAKFGQCPLRLEVTIRALDQRVACRLKDRRKVAFLLQAKSKTRTLHFSLTPAQVIRRLG